MPALLAHRAEKWTRFSAKSDAPIDEEASILIPKVESTFASDALAVPGLLAYPKLRGLGSFRRRGEMHRG
jgi:hypothetical protein